MKFDAMTAREIAETAPGCRALAAPVLIGHLATLVADLQARFEASELRQAAMVEAFAREIAELEARFAKERG